MCELCRKITDGTHKTPVYQKNGITFISAKNIIDGKLDFSDVKYINQTEYSEIQKRCQTEYGDVLMSKSGSLGALAIVDTQEPLGLFESLAVLKYDRDRVDGVFLKEQLRSDSAQGQLMQGVKGVAVKHLHLNVINEIEVIIPPMDQQRAFSDFVRQSDKSKFLAQMGSNLNLSRCLGILQQIPRVGHWSRYATVYCGLIVERVSLVKTILVKESCQQF